MKKIIVTLLIFLFAHNIVAQNIYVDSLKTDLANTTKPIDLLTC